MGFVYSNTRHNNFVGTATSQEAPSSFQLVTGINW